ncbi:hypothetical protein [Thiohalocapsa sp. ML1]|jgi:hypothetical protein|uniref:hypothetical protein n=1 Tax=Thiohalocapsa sp. ML1 TaxID=1431688 RepID=UPI0007321AC9|nr:hypothetical protein [Thiohalocapsa sp. ML1]
MLKRPAATLTLLAVLALALPATAGAGESGEDHDSPFAGMHLLLLMHNMQYYTHKLGLAIDAHNAALEAFYIHEVEAVIEAVGEIEDYEGIPIADNLKKTLLPNFQTLEAAIDKGEREAVDAAYKELLVGCNACHAASEHGYIHIRRSYDNPYPQDFSPHD